MPLPLNKPPRRYKPADLLRSHPLAQGLVLFTFPGDGAIDLVTGKIPIAHAGYGTIATQYGSAANMAQGTNNALTYPTAPLISANTSANSMVVFSKPSSVSRVTQPIRLANPGVTVLEGFLFNCDQAGSPSAGTLTYWNYSSGIEFSAQKVSAIDGNWHSFGVTRSSASTGDLYVDGAAQGAAITGSFATNCASPQNVYICGDPADSVDFACDYPVLFVAVWNRALSAVEHQAFSNNPWQMFRPQPKRVLFGVAAGGNVNLTIPQASLSLNGQLPTITDTRAIPAASMVLTGNAPTLGGGTTLTIPVASLGLNDQVPNLTTTLAMPVAAPVLTGQVPTLTTTLNAPAAAVVLTAGGPTLSLQIAVPAASLVFNGLAPSLNPVQNYSIPAASLSLTDYAPTITMTLKVPSAPVSIGCQAPTLIGGNQSTIFEWDQRARRRRGR